MDERTVAAQIKTHGGNFLAVQWLGLKSCQLCGVAKTKPWRWTASHRFKGEQMSGGKQRRDGRKDGGLIWSWIIGSMVWIRKRLNQKSGDLSSSPTSLLTHLSDGEVRLTWREMWRLKWGRVYEGPVHQLQSSVRAFHSPKQIFVWFFFFFCPLLPYPCSIPNLLQVGTREPQGRPPFIHSSQRFQNGVLQIGSGLQMCSVWPIWFFFF